MFQDVEQNDVIWLESRTDSVGVGKIGKSSAPKCFTWLAKKRSILEVLFRYPSPRSFSSGFMNR
jgi:hypothetical protein